MDWRIPPPAAAGGEARPIKMPGLAADEEENGQNPGIQEDFPSEDPKRVSWRTTYVACVLETDAIIGGLIVGFLLKSLQDFDLEVKGNEFIVINLKLIVISCFSFRLFIFVYMLIW